MRDAKYVRKTEEELLQILQKLAIGQEQDLDNQITALAFLSEDFVSDLPLA